MTLARAGLLFVAYLMCLANSGCSKHNDAGRTNGKSEGGGVLRGAGSTFAAPLYRKWSDEYRTVKSEVRIEYDAVGSGEGQERFLKGTVDFGASDAVLTSEQIAKVAGGVLMIPIATGGIVLAYNSEGLVDGLKLPREVYVDIFLDKIKTWNDPRIAAANPGVTLPKLPIERIVRTDSSGTTFAFTNHLSAVSNEWRDGPGVGKLPAWPGHPRKAPGNEKVAGMIKNTYGGIGYVEYGTARVAGLFMAQLENKQGEFVAPSGATIQAAIAGADATADKLAQLPDPPTARAYPIVTCTWLLANKHPADAKKSEALREFVQFCLTKGQDSCDALGYVRLTPEVTAATLQKIDELRR